MAKYLIMTMRTIVVVVIMMMSYYVDEDDSHGGLSCSWGDLLLNSPGGSVLICKHLKKLHQSVGSLLIRKKSPLLYYMFQKCAHFAILWIV